MVGKETKSDSDLEFWRLIKPFKIHTSKIMLISVIIPSYNRPDLISYTIDSILSQTVDADIEIIIGDDCSNEATRAVLLDFKGRYPEVIHLIFHERNIGLGANWATCVKACKGDFICNCDNDDYWHNPNKLQIQLDYMTSHLQTNVLFTGYRTHNRKTGRIKEYKTYINREIPLQQAFWAGDFKVCNASIMYRADFLKRYLPLDDFISYHFSLQDWPTWIILSAYTDFDVIEESTTTFGIDTTSITRPKSVKVLKCRMDKDLKCYKYCCNMFPQMKKYVKTEWNTYENKVLLAASYRTNDFENAHYYSGLLRDKRTIKILAAKSRITFFIYSSMLKMKRIIYNGGS